MVMMMTVMMMILTLKMNSRPLQMFSAFSDYLLFMISLNVTDGRTDERADGRTDPFTEMRGRI